MEQRGFQVIGSAALVARHSIVPEVGEGRPDEQDRKEWLPLYFPTSLHYGKQRVDNSCQYNAVYDGFQGFFTLYGSSCYKDAAVKQNCQQSFSTLRIAVESYVDIV